MNVARIVLLTGLLLGGCADDGGPRGAGPGHAPDPFARGPFSVGVRTVQLLRDQRVLRVELWYPATLGAGQEERDAVDLLVEAPDDVRTTLEAAGLKSQPLVQAAARDAAPLAAADRAAGFPVVLFSHGNAGSRLQSHFLTTHLASHGYIVVAPDHPGNTLYDTADGKNPLDSAAFHAVERPKDISALLDALSAGTLTDDGEIEALADVERVAASGHSFGGFTALFMVARKSALYDERIDAAVPLAPATEPLDLFAAPASTIIVPTLYIGGKDDVTATYQAQLVPGYSAQPPPKALVALDGVGHLGFTNMCGADIAEAAKIIGAPPVMLAGIKDGCGAQYRDPQTVFRLIDGYAAAWLAITLRDSAESARWLSAQSGVELRLELE